MTTQTAALDDHARRRSIGFLNWAHFLDHYVILIFPTVVIGLEAVYGRSYGELLVLSTAAFTAFGLFALPSGWLADKWSRRNMIALYYFGTGICCALVGASDSFETLAIALFGVGLFAAIYHPVGTPMIVDAAVTRGRTMAFNGICGNIGVSIASGCTALIASALGWRYTFFIPAIVFVLSGFAYLKFVPDTGRRVVQAPDQDVALSKSLTVAVVILFLILAFWVGLVFNALTIMLPKLVEQRVGFDISLREVGVLATCVFLCGGMAQFTMGRMVERVVPHLIMSAIAAIQVVGVLLAYWASGWWLLPSLALAVAAIYGQVTVNDLVLARYTPAGWRGRIYAIRFFLIFTMAGPAAWGIGRLYEQGGFDVVLGVGAVIAALGALNTFAISVLVTGAENRRVAEKRAAQQRAATVVQPAE
ncbi:MAG TPA: MFS transporter [Xanthobacteraceae bacterium]|nr:MFS transporter [Xanthobacteraceae bacterium]